MVYCTPGRGQAIGLASMGVSSAGIVLPTVMTLVIDQFGWRAGWRLLAVFVLLLGYPAALIMRRSPEDMGLTPTERRQRRWRGVAAPRLAPTSLTHSRGRRALRPQETLYLLVLAFGFGSLGLITMIVITIPYLTDSGFSRGLAALMVSVMAIPSASQSLSGATSSDRFSERVTTSVSFAMNAGALSLIVLAAAAHMTALLVAGYFLVGWGIGGQIPLQESIWATYSAGATSAPSVSCDAVHHAVFSSRPLLVAMSYDRFGSYDGALYGVAAGWAIAAVVILFVRRPVHRHSPSLEG